ncbi:unnamed protein product [Caenorhabditis angaria]|uniref:Uncharacterized protein n=1 Tax=Caenorhabditis angaria TaxID=860376 RepID=A0A9P1IRU7_9PELO|nr:unnamed protein product [Caenorhabditis angaria]
MRWERGIVSLISHNSTYVATPYDQVTMYMGNSFELGDCIEFIADDRRRIIEARRCERFVDYDLKFSGISIVLICEVLDVRMEFVTFWNRRARCFRTNFIEKVYDIPMNPKTDFYTEDQLIGSKIVICRVPTSDKAYSFWKVSNVSDIHWIKPLQQQTIQVSDLIRPIENSKRTFYTGWICTYGSRKPGKDELWVWIPFRKHVDIMFPANFRNNIHRDQFYGRWVQFSMSHPFTPDEESKIELIDDVFPTRKFEGKWEIKVPCKYDSQDKRGLIDSDVVGKIDHFQDILEKYNRFDSFSENLWVTCNGRDKRKGCRFLLSTLQNDWEHGKTLEEIEDLKLDFLRLEKKHQYLLENSLPIPEKLVNDLEQMEEVLYSSRKANEIEMEKYKQLVIHFRDMLASEKVCEEMQKFDPEKLEQINALLFDM